MATTRLETMLGDTAVAVHPEDDRYKAPVGPLECRGLFLRVFGVLEGFLEGFWRVLKGF